MLCVYLDPQIIPEFYCVCAFKRHHLLEMKEVKEQLIWTSSKNSNKWAARVFHMVISHEQMRQLPKPVILPPVCTFYLSGELLKIPIPRHHPHRQNQQSQRWGPDFRAHLKLPSELNSQPNLGVLNLGLLSHQSTWPKYPVLGKFGIMAFQLCFITLLGKQPLLRHPLFFACLIHAVDLCPSVLWNLQRCDSEGEIEWKPALQTSLGNSPKWKPKIYV